MQKALLQSDVQSKNDKSPVTVADYGLFSSFVLNASWLLSIFYLICQLIIMDMIEWPVNCFVYLLLFL